MKCGNLGLFIALDRGRADGHAVFTDDGGDFAEHVQPVIGNDGNGGVEGILAVAGPFHGNAAFLLAGGGVDAFRLVDGDAAAAGDIAHDLIPGHGAAALGEADRNIQVLAAGEDDTVMRTVLAEARMNMPPPQANPMAAVTQRPAAVVRPLTMFSCLRKMMVPAPMKPMPLTT